jgi:hypothetical protein
MTYFEGVDLVIKDKDLQWKSFEHQQDFLHDFEFSDRGKRP